MKNNHQNESKNNVLKDFFTKPYKIGIIHDITFDQVLVTNHKIHIIAVHIAKSIAGILFLVK